MRTRYSFAGDEHILVEVEEEMSLEAFFNSLSMTNAVRQNQCQKALLSSSSMPLYELMLQSGIVLIYIGLNSTGGAAFTGTQEPGIDREGSKCGIDEFCEFKYVCSGGYRSGSSLSEADGL